MAGMTKEQAKIMSQLLEMDGAVNHGAKDVYSEGICSPSPALNYCFDNTWLLPQGYTLLMGGKAKGGKSLIINSMIGQLHKDDPDAIVLRWNTEMRESAQTTPHQLAVWGIDPHRLRAFEANRPELIFDKIEEIVPKMCQAGLKLRLVVIDSLNDIVGRRTQNADSVLTMQIGDRALTLQDGLGRIKSILRKNNVSLIMTCHVRAEMDMAEQMRGHKERLAVPHYVKHTAEYFLRVERLETKAGRTDLLGNDFKDTTRTVNMTGAGRSDGEESGHKIRVKMMDSSLGRPGREGVFTLDHDKGIINTHEEYFLLANMMRLLNVGGGGNYSLINHDAFDPEIAMYIERTWRGKENILRAFKEDATLCRLILRACKRVDLDRKSGIFYDENGKKCNSELPPPAAPDVSENSDSFL
jgi:hypothetical protein